MDIYMLEIKRFFKDNQKFIIATTLILGILIAGLNIFLNQSSELEEQNTEVVESQGVFNEDSRPAFFRFYVENSDGYAFSNAVTLDQLFNLGSVYDDVKAETNIDIKKIKETALEKGNLDFSPVRVSVDYDSYIFIATFETGNNSKNLQLANFYNNLLLNNEISILENHTIYSLVEPQLVPELEEATDEEAEEGSNKEILDQTQRTLMDWVKEIVISLIIGLVLAAVFSTGVMLLKELFGKKLNYFFGYDGESFDNYIVYDKQLANDESVQYFVGLDNSLNKLILMESEINQSEKEVLFNNLEFNFDFSQSITSTRISNKYDEIILIVNPCSTTRKWFNNQVKLIGLHDAKTKLVQMNLGNETLNKKGS